MQGPSGTFSDLERENRRYSLQVTSNLSFLGAFWRKIVNTQENCFFLKKGIVPWNVLNTMQRNGAKSVEKLRRHYRKTEKKVGKKRVFA